MEQKVQLVFLLWTIDISIYETSWSKS